MGVERIFVPTCSRFVLELGPDPTRCERVGEEDRAERDRARAGGHQLECVEPGSDTTHSHDRHIDGRRTGVDARERDRLQRRSGVAAGGAGEQRAQRRVEREPADRVDEREPVGPGRDDGSSRRGDVPLSRGKLCVERLPRRGASGCDELRRGLRAPRRRSGTRG